MDSTWAKASWPTIHGNRPSGSHPVKVYRSVWQSAFDIILILTSQGPGGATSIVSIYNGWLGPYATAALHFIVNAINILIKFL